MVAANTPRTTISAIEVPVDRIEAELAALWRHAAEARPGQILNAVTRACLWNLVVRVQGEARFTTAKRVIDELSLRIPARTIILRLEPDAPEELRAWVEANWRRREGGGPASGSDEVTLLAAGKAVERVPSLVRALLLSDAPTAMFWTASPAPPFPNYAAGTWGPPEADRLIEGDGRIWRKP